MNKKSDQDNEKNSKPDEDIIFKICNAILRLEVEKGRLGWKISDIARYADVTRSLIYYYFGKDKETIVEEAYRYMLELIFDHKKGTVSIHDRIANGIYRIKQMPYVLILFFLERRRDSEIGEIIRKAEKKLLSRIAIEYPELTPLEVKKIFLLELGAVVYLDLDSDDIANLFQPFIK